MLSYYVTNVKNKYFILALQMAIIVSKNTPEQINLPELSGTACPGFLDYISPVE